MTTLNTPRETTHQRIADALEDIVDKIVDTSSASNIDYSNTTSGLSANKVQSAIDELALAGFVTNTVNNLVNYYLKSETYNKTEVDNLINAVKNSRFEAVSTLPTSNIKTNVIYLVPKSPTQTNNAKDEYINLDGTTSGWEKIGDTEVDLSGYVTTTALNTALSNYTTTSNLTNLLNNKVDKVSGKGLSTNDYTTAEKNKLAGIETGANKTVVDTVLSDTSTNPVQNKVAKAEFDTITEVDTEIDTAPYLYRAVDGHNTVYDKLVGGSVVVNQLAKGVTYSVNGITITNSNGELTINGTATATTYSVLNSTEKSITNHKYFVTLNNKNAPGSILLYNDSKGIVVYNTPKIQNATGSSNWYLKIDGGATLDNVKVTPQIIDLTLMFGTIIADYVYSLEQATSGSGIAWLKSYGYLTEDYIPYNSGSLESVKAESKKVVGKNLLPYPFSNTTKTLNGITFTDIGDGTIKVNGTATAISDFYLSADDFLNLPVGSYILTCDNLPNNCYFVFGDGGGISYVNVFGSMMPFSFSVTENSVIKYCRVRIVSGATLSNVIIKPMIRLATETDSTFEPYTETTYDLGNDELRGILQLESNKLVYDGDIKTSDRKISRKYGIVDLGSLDWTYQASNTQFYTGVLSDVVTGRTTNVVCSKYTVNAEGYESDTNPHTRGVIDGRIYIVDGNFTDATALKNSLSGVYLIYPLATPTTEISTPFTSPQMVYPNGTEEYISPIPVGHESEYVDIPEWMQNKYFDDLRLNNSKVNEIEVLLETVNSRERRDITNYLANLSIAVAEQNLAKYGYKIGDYFTGPSGYTYHLANMNTFKGTVTPYCLTTNHIGIVVDTHTTSQWHTENASSVGYNGSTLHTYLKGPVMDNIKADMIALFGGSTGLEHLLAHTKLLTSALANWDWQANQYISALTCTQIDAGSQWTANEYQEGEASKSLELFRKYKWTEIFGREYPWLRNLSNYSTGGSCACNAYNTGPLSGRNSVTFSGFVVGLINFY